MSDIQFKAVITGAHNGKAGTNNTGDDNKVAFTRSNGSRYFLQEATFLEGPMEGKPVTGEFTVLNSKGETKELMAQGEECTVYISQLPSTKEAGQMVYFFSIGRAMTAQATQEELHDAFGGLFQGAEVKEKELF